MLLKYYLNNMNFITVNNHQSIPVASIPELNYNLFLETNTGLMENHPERHCVLYFGYRLEKSIHLICCIADDNDHDIKVSSSVVRDDAVLDSDIQIIHGSSQFAMLKTGQINPVL
jgi:hypothetical protein